MPIYKYKAVKNGEEYEGKKEVADKTVLYGEVKREGGTIVSVKEEKQKSGINFSMKLTSGVKADEKISFAKNLATMLEAGISLSRAFTIVAKQSKNKNLLAILESLHASIDQGKAFSEAMKEHRNVFSDLFIMMVKAGEESGKIVESLRIVADQMDRSNKLTKKIKGAMIYPTIVVIVMIVLGIVLMVYMVPTLTETFRGLGIDLPLPTRIIIAISDFMRANLILIIAAMIAFVVGVIYFFRTPKGKRVADFVVLHAPLISPITKEVNSARTARTLSSLVSSGVSIVAAIEVTRDVLQNSFYKEVLEKAGETIQKGGAISGVFSEAKGLYPVYVGEMTAVGEETGELSKMLENIADFYEDEVDQRTKDLSTIIEPILMILIGLGVGVFAISMLLPTYSLVDVIQ
ncbi:MAG TPA: type II secretion system F family protein [Candidatus Paceibacterota bacterium]